jgi:hypothetical protein
MKRSLLVVILLCFAVQLSNAQLWKLRRWEAQFGIGPSFAFPDIGGYTQGDNILGFKDLSYRQTRFDINGSLRYRLGRTANLKLSMTYAMLHATDDRGSNEGRELEANTSLFEPALMFEYYFIKNKYESSYLFLKGKGLWALLSSLDFYAFGGIGADDFSVKLIGDIGGSYEFVKDGGFSAVIPGGIGATLVYNPNLNFGIEFGGRYAFTDYLDGYTSQFSKANDVYYLLNFTVSYKFKTNAKGWPALR